MREIYWGMMIEKKFHIIYLGKIYGSSVKIERLINVFLAITAIGSLAGFFTNPSLQKIWSVLLILSPVLTVVKPYLPFLERIYDLDNSIALFKGIYSEIEGAWIEYEKNSQDDEKLRESYNLLVKKWDNVENSILKGDYIGQNKKIVEEANKENKMYFYNRFNAKYEID